MAKENETITDIIAEMRIFKCRDLSTGELEECTAISKYLADRLDAAHKREVDALSEQIADLSQQRDLWSKRAAELVEKCNEQYAKLKQVGNAAKLREACANIAAYARSAQCHATDAHILGYLSQIEMWACAALAAPMRNCDRFASAEEAWDAYDAWVESYRSKGKTEPFNEFGWLFAPATEQEGGANV